jgi:hypothetical protein
MRLDPDARLTGAEAARLLGLTRQAVYMWRQRDQLAAGDDGLYRLGDVLAVNGSMRRSPNSRRKVAA